MMDMQKVDGLRKGARKRKRLGEFLVDAGSCRRYGLGQGPEVQKITRKKLGQVLIDMGAVDEHEIARTLSKQFNIPLVPLDNTEIPKEIIDLVPAEMAEGISSFP